MPVVSQDVSAAGAGNREFVQELDDGAALLLGAEAEILAHRPVLPRPFLDNWPLAGRKAPDLAPPALGDLLGRLWTRCREQRRACTAELIVSGAPATRPVCLSLRVAPHHRFDDVSVVTVRDLTRDRCRVQDLLERSETLRAQREEWEGTARTFAHDVRSSLAALNGFLNLTLTRSGDLPAPAVEFLDRALSVSDRLRSLAETVVRSPDTAEPPPEPVHLGQLGHRLFRALQAAHPDVAFTWCVGAAEETAAASGTLLWDALWNLLENAVKYRSPERELHVELRAWCERDEVLVEIRDNGRGIPPEEEDRLFQRGHRGSRVDGVSGSGLGLYSVRRLLEKCSGRVWLEPGSYGACFRLSLPTWVT